MTKVLIFKNASVLVVKTPPIARCKGFKDLTVTFLNRQTAAELSMCLNSQHLYVCLISEKMLTSGCDNHKPMNVETFVYETKISGPVESDESELGR